MSDIPTNLMGAAAMPVSEAMVAYHPPIIEDESEELKPPPKQIYAVNFTQHTAYALLKSGCVSLAHKLACITFSDVGGFHVTLATDKQIQAFVDEHPDEEILEVTAELVSAKLAEQQQNGIKEMLENPIPTETATATATAMPQEEPKQTNTENGTSCLTSPTE